MSAPSLGGVQVPRGNGDILRLPRGASLSDFADRINANPASLVTVMFHLGEMVTATESVNDADARSCSVRSSTTSSRSSRPEDEDRELLDVLRHRPSGRTRATTSDLVASARPSSRSWVTSTTARPSSSTRMRNANQRRWSPRPVASPRHIGAYQVLARMEDVDGEVTERPDHLHRHPGSRGLHGHACARFAAVTDIAVLVVAADDGVMPQTVEALNHAQAAGFRSWSRSTRSTKTDANPAKVRQQLTEYGLVAEEYGGDTMFVDVSAKTSGSVSTELLEAVLLTADASSRPAGQPEPGRTGRRPSRRTSTAVVVRWPRCWSSAARCAWATRSSPATGYGRVRAMLDENGANMQEADPARPVQVLGLSTAVPGAGQTPSSWPRRTGWPARSPRSARPVERNAHAGQVACKRISLEDFTKALKRGQVEAAQPDPQG